MRSRVGKKGTVLIAVVALAATAAAGGALAAVAARTTATSATVTTKINVTESDYAIALSQSTNVPTGYVVFVVKNTGSTAHRFGVKGKNFTTKSILSLIHPGQTKTLKVQFLKKGTYTAFCKLHLSVGMKAALAVGSPGSTTTHTTTTGTTTTPYRTTPRG
jgi:plastocyanin